MKKINVLILTLLTLVILAACGSTDENNEAGATEITITLTITDQTSDNTIDQSEYTVEEGTILIDVLEDNYDVEMTGEGWLSSIEGASESESDNYYWLYEVNGEMANVGVSEYEVEDKDDITFDLQELE